MHFPTHWAKASATATASGKQLVLSCWRWSEVSVAEARELAQKAARELAARVARTGELPRGGYYAERPLREPVLRRVTGPGGEQLGLVSRNAYGCEVLNTERVMFVDVDLAQAPAAPSLLGKLLGSRAEAPDPLAKVRAFVKARPAWGFRVYRTRAGLRLLATHAPIASDAPEARAAFEALGADPLYVTLCRTQESYRARLTPKPWRIGLQAPHVRWPFEDAEEERRMQAWLDEYTRAAQSHATCAFVEALGNPRVAAAIEPIVALHDAATGASRSAPLA